MYWDLGVLLTIVLRKLDILVLVLPGLLLLAAVLALLSPLPTGLLPLLPPAEGILVDVGLGQGGDFGRRAFIGNLKVSGPTLARVELDAVRPSRFGPVECRSGGKVSESQSKSGPIKGEKFRRVEGVVQVDIAVDPVPLIVIVSIVTNEISVLINCELNTAGGSKNTGFLRVRARC